MDWKGKIKSDTRVDVNERMRNGSLVRLSRQTEGPKKREGVRVGAYLEFLAVCACSWTRLGLIQENRNRYIDIGEEGIHPIRPMRDARSPLVDSD